MTDTATTAHLVAYQVDEDYEGTSAVVFATNGAAARREGACELGMRFEEVDRCRRVPQFDSFAPGPVPRSALLDAGWWFTCAHCGSKVSKAGAEDADDGETGGERRELVLDGVSVYCDAVCRATRMAYEIRRDTAKNTLVEFVATRYPEATKIHAHLYADRLETAPKGHQPHATATFCLPELEHPVTYHFGETTVLVNHADADTFLRRYSSRPTAPAEPAA